MTATQVEQEWSEDRIYEFRMVDSNDKRSRIVGMAAPYNQESPIRGEYVEVLAPGCFRKSIKEAARGLPLHARHESDKWPVGRSLRWEESEEGLIGEWEMAGTTEAREAYELVRDGFVTGLSVGFQPFQSDVDPGTDTRPPRVVRKEARLFEVSLVSTPAYAQAQVMLVRTAGLVRPTPHLSKWREWRRGIA